MKVHILTNALDYGDGVSNNCIFLKRRCLELGVPAEIYARFYHPDVEHEGKPVSQLLEGASEEDVLLHSFFNDTKLLPYVEQFPGKRVLMYHNITPPQYFPADSPFHYSSRRGLHQVGTLTGLYDLALGASDFSRRDLEEMGYANTGVFPLLPDLEALQSIPPDPAVMMRAVTEGIQILFVGRVVANKRIEDLLQFVYAYRALGRKARLVIAGDDTAHPRYKASLDRLAAQLGLELGKDVLFTGKIPAQELVVWYRTSHLFVCMSEHEGFCVPLIESMAFGLITFAYAAAAVEETMGGAGVLFREKDFAALARSAADALENPDRKAELLANQERRLLFFTDESKRHRVRALLDRLQAMPSRSEHRGTPTVSVVINTYNRAGPLERCLSALNQQRYTNFEVVVVNGPSTDDTEEICARYGNRIRIVRTDSRILSLSRNLGIEVSRGTLVAFVDDDAVPDPGWIEELVPAFDDPAVGAAGGLVYRLASGDVEWRNGIIGRSGKLKLNRLEPGEHWDWEEGYLNTVTGTCAMFRRSALEHVRGFDERIEYHFDEYDVVIRLEKAGYRTTHRPRAIVHHESAPSHNRASPLDMNWYVMCKNEVYGLLKNHAGPGSRRLFAARVIRCSLQQRVIQAAFWWVLGQIGLRTFLRIEWGCLRGLVAGLRNGINLPPKLREIRTVPAGPGIVRFPEAADRPLSVCLLSRTLPWQEAGGVATYTYTLARALQKLGCTVHLISQGEPLPAKLQDRIWHHSVAPASLSESMGLEPDMPTSAASIDYSYGAWQKILEVSARFGLDIVEAPSWSSEGLIAALDERIPTVVRLHSALFSVGRMQGWDESADFHMACELERAQILLADGVTGSTEAVMSLFSEHYQTRSERTSVIPLGLDLAPLPPAHKPDSGLKRVLFVGRLETRKGIADLLDAIPHVLEVVPQARFDIVGRDVTPPEERVVAWRRTHPLLSERVRFHGEISAAEVDRHYAECDLFVAPSLYESFGLVFLEAMARGKAVIGTTAGGIPEVVSNGESGVLVPPGDVASLVEAIIGLLQDDAHRLALGRKGLDRYRALFTAERMAEKTLAFYKEVTKASRNRVLKTWNPGSLTGADGERRLIGWDALSQSELMAVEPGVSGYVAVTTPLRLGPGSYRVTYSIWSDSDVADSTRVCTINAHVRNRSLTNKLVRVSDFGNSCGSLFDLFFELGGTVQEDVEFRVYSHGAIPFRIREVRVASVANRDLGFLTKPTGG